MISSTSNSPPSSPPPSDLKDLAYRWSGDSTVKCFWLSLPEFNEPPVSKEPQIRYFTLLSDPNERPAPTGFIEADFFAKATKLTAPELTLLHLNQYAALYDHLAAKTPHFKPRTSLP